MRNKSKKGIVIRVLVALLLFILITPSIKCFQYRISENMKSMSWKDISSNMFSAEKLNGITRISQNTLLGDCSSFGIVKSTDNGITWVKLSANNYYYSIFAVSDSIIVAGKNYEIYLSKDGGVKWDKVYSNENPLYPNFISSIVLGPYGAIYAAHYGIGVLKSTDHGTSWVNMSNGISNPLVTDIIVSDDSSIFVCANNWTSGYSSNGRVVFRSMNQAISWNDISFNLQNNQVTSLVQTRAHSILAHSNHGIYKYVDGQRWDLIASNTGHITDFKIDKEGSIYGFGDFVSRSTNDGYSWQRLKSKYDEPYLFGDVGGVFGDTLYYQMFRSINKGASWKFNNIDGGPTAMAIQAVDAKKIWVVSSAIIFSKNYNEEAWLTTDDYDTQLFRNIWTTSTGAVISYDEKMKISYDQGKTWLRTLDASIKTIGCNQKSIVAIESNGYKIFQSNNDGMDWTVLVSPPTSASSIIIDNKNTVFISSDNQIFKLSATGWVKSDSGINSPSNYIFGIKKSVNDDLFAFTANGLFISKNHGSYWEKLVTPNSYIKNVFIASNGMVVINSSTSAYLSKDYGKKWESIPGLPNSNYVDSFCEDSSGGLYSLIKGRVYRTSENIVPEKFLVHLSPSINEVWASLDTVQLHWVSRGVQNNVNIELSVNNGISYEYLLLSNTPNDGTEKVKLPDISSAECYIKISAVGEPTVQNISIRSFPIHKPYVEVLQPSLPWGSRTNATLRWKHYGQPDSATILLSVDSGKTFTTFITHTYTSNDSESFEVPDVRSSHCYVRIVSKSRGTIFGTSKHYFSVDTASISCSIPTTMLEGGYYKIDYKSVRVYDENIKFEISLNNGASYDVEVKVIDTTNKKMSFILPFRIGVPLARFKISYPRYPWIKYISQPVSISPFVYPGDANSDFTVDIHDILSVARFYGLKLPRRSAAFRFEGYTGAQTNPLDLTYADCNGDGIIDTADVGVIIKYWRNKHYFNESTLSSEVSPNENVLDDLFNIIDLQMMDPTIVDYFKRHKESIESFSLPDYFIVGQNFPNPFNATTTISIIVPKGVANLTFNIANTLGQIIDSKIINITRPGRHEIVWESRQQLSSGVYFYTINDGKRTVMKKMVMQK